MRLLAVVMAGLLVGTGCASTSYKIPSSELQRLSMVPPEARGQRVLVSQEISATDVEAAEPVGPDTQIIIGPDIHISGGGVYDGGPRHGGGGGRPVSGGGGGKGGGLKLGSGGGDAKGAAVAVVILAAVVLVAAVGVEGSRFDGWVQLHPMHPVHLIGRDGSQTVMPLAAIDGQTAAWTETAIVRSTEGPWLQLERKPLTRTGSYGMYAGSGSLKSVTGNVEFGPSFVIQGGYFPEQHVGLLATISFAWRDNQFGGTLFDSRYLAELQALPIDAGKLHLGGYVGAGLGYRWEDVPGTTLRGNQGTTVFTGGAMLQLELHTRIALTARLAAVRAHDDRMTDLLFGVAVY